MSEIEVGEYVRTINGEIGKFKGYNANSKSQWKYRIKFQKVKTWKYCAEGYILKHSENLIDLIEIKDLVEVFVEENIDENGTTEDTCVYEVITTQVKDIHGNKTNEIGISGDEGVELIPFTNVRSIVTKEQFENITYKL